MTGIQTTLDLKSKQGIQEIPRMLMSETFELRQKNLTIYFPEQ